MAVPLPRSVEVHNHVHMRATRKKKRHDNDEPRKRGGCSVFYVLSATTVALPRSVGVHNTYARYEKKRDTITSNPGSTKQA